MRARLPDESGYVVNDGVRVYYEVFGTGPTTVLLMPTWSILDSRHWKMQVPFLARRYRVITFDGRGNGRSDRPRTSAAYSDDAFVGDAIAVLDAAGAERLIVAGFCTGFVWSLLLATAYPQRVVGLVAIAPTLQIGPPHPARAKYSFEDVLDTDDGWAKTNQHYWRRDWPGFVEFFMSQIASEPHSTKVQEDLVGWGMQTDADTMLCEAFAPRGPRGSEAATKLLRRVTCPVLVIVGERDRIIPPERARLVAEFTGATLLEIDGAGHAPHARFPVAVNHAIRDFVDSADPYRRTRRATWSAAASRPRRALWISSPIGLGHVHRDLAIARAVRRRVPDLEIHWWAQPPVTEVLAEAGEIIHPASAEMASESAHWESEAGDHDLHAFYAMRQMDEILCANYLLFDDVVRDTRYDLWAGDECWEVDYYLHENPERKIAPYVFMTDVIGFLPTDPADPREAELCADSNADAIEKRERFPGVRDVSMFIGSWPELPDASFGPGLPNIRAWSRRWFTSAPYVYPFDPAEIADRTALRRELGHDGAGPLIVSAVGGTGVGVDLLALVADAFGRLRKEVPEARMLMVTGPRIDPRSLPDVEGLDKRGYLPDLYRHLACCDAAVVQGGLSTTMELVALGRPFVYFPLGHHWEQQHFVTHRLRHYRAGTAMHYETTSSDDLVTAVQRAMATDTTGYRPITPGGAIRAAEQIVPLLTGRL